jgi:hypothetical protein
MSKERRRLALLAIGLTNIKKTVAVIDELVLLDGEYELRALTQRLQGAIPGRVPIRQMKRPARWPPLLRFSA